VLRLMGGALFLIGMIVFVLGLIAGLVALRQGRRRSLAIGGIALNVVNLVLDAGFVISASSR
jgi:hypothetical protein